ncbi:MAG: TraR/DksA family transcriptional regulator [Pseudomonadota bacterium]
MEPVLSSRRHTDEQPAAAPVAKPGADRVADWAAPMRAEGASAQPLQPLPAGPAWLHSAIELPLLLLLRQRLLQQLETAAAWSAVLPPAAAGLALDSRGGASLGPAVWRPVRSAGGDPRAARAALRRMAEGRYGWCLRCGQAISRDRLLAQPAASACETCATGRADAADTGLASGLDASPGASPDASEERGWL